VAALTRHNATALAALGAEPLAGDILDPAALRQLPETGMVLNAVGFDRTSGRSMREVYVDGLINVLDALAASGRYIHISSTSVYGQADGGWVDETSPTEPAEESGRVVLEAERVLRARRPDAIVLRFGGIYGPKRMLRRITQLRSGEPMAGDPARWLNLIHVEDGVEAVLAAELRGQAGETYNVVDDLPAPRRAYYEHLAALLEAPVPRFDGRTESRQADRRVSNAKAKSELGWQPRYPSYREGLPDALGETTME
jgi:nucleoside-diphosphate-sugar epimerase